MIDDSGSSGLERRTLWLVCAALLVVYFATLAPNVTLWDAGEFNAAIAAFGIPHPPGTPLYILLARDWVLLTGSVPQVVAVNALSAVATALACGLLARLVVVWTHSAAAGVAGGICAGAMYSVWQNATETEIYALSLLLAVVLLVLAERAAHLERLRDRGLLAYAMGLAVPLQISALVAAPAAVLLAGTPRDRDRGPVPRRLVALGGATVLAMGIGLVSPWLVGAGLVVLAVSVIRRRFVPGRMSTAEPLALAAAVALGASVTLFMLLRAAHDPAINQGNPSTWSRLLGVIARRQYDVPGLWPRRAPTWLQVANLLQYSDWQVAMGLDPAVGASWLRTPFSVVFAMLALIGARWHWRRDRRSARVLAFLLLSGTLGVVAVLNLHAGPSIGYGVLPQGALREARERDYFFALAFAVAALWAGVGAVAIASRAGPRVSWLGVVVAAVPVALNWNATNRRRMPDASLPAALGDALLASAPPHAVLLLAGDNDSYAVWFQQQVRGRRRDVTPITLPLLPAEWYRAELARRDSLFGGSQIPDWTDERAALDALAGNAARLGRPLAVAAAVPRDTRMHLGASWTLRGLAFVDARDGSATAQTLPDFADRLDSVATDSVARRIQLHEFDAGRWARDPSGRYVQALLSCPGAVTRRAEESRQLLASTCNFK